MKDPIEELKALLVAKDVKILQLEAELSYNKELIKLHEKQWADLTRMIEDDAPILSKNIQRGVPA